MKDKYIITLDSGTTSCRSIVVNKKGEIVVCVFTGNGLKDPDTALGVTTIPITKMDDLEDMKKHLQAGVKNL